MAMMSRALGYATLLGTMSVQATNYYVDPSLGADTNPGGEAAPWKTLARVNSANLLPGDAVLLKRGGVWAETLRPPTSGISGSPIIFDAYGSGELPQITGKLNSSCIHWTVPRSYLVFRNLHLSNCGQPDGYKAGGINVWSSGGLSTGILVENSIIEGSQTWNIFMDGMKDLIIRNNIIRGAELEHGIYFSGELGFSGALIEGNEIYNNKAMCIQFNPNAGDRLTGVVMRYNLLHDCGYGGINNLGAAGAEFYYNVIHGSMSGIYNTCDGADSGCAHGATGGVYVNNTILSKGSSWTTCFGSESNLGSPDFKAFVNNICWHDAPSGEAFGDNETTSNARVEYNQFYSPRGDVKIGRKGLIYLTFSAYQKAYPADVGQLYGDPRFINSAAGDFRLSPESPAIDSGISWGLNRDLSNSFVPSGLATDRGAFEFTQGGVIPPPPPPPPPELPIGAPYNLRAIQ